MKKIPIQVRLPKGTLSEIDKSVKTGKFMNRSDFIRDSIRKVDQTKSETLEKGLSNLSEHENLAPRLLKIEKKLDKIQDQSIFNFVSIMTIIALLLIFGGMLL